MTSTQSYDVAGPANAHPIVFLHGMRVSRQMWRPQMESLAAEFRVIALDLAGHGALRSEPFHVETCVEEIARGVDELAGGRALIVGLSLGGYMAMEFGARYPRKAAGLLIASASVEPRGWYNMPYRGLSRIMDKVPEKLAGALNRWLFLLVYGERRAQPLIAGGFFMRGGASGIREVMKREYVPKIAAYPGPVLFLNGEMDLGFRMHEKRFLAAAKRGRLELIPHAFHIANIDQPEAFTDAVRRFAKSIGNEW
ncbi:MAG TPA: alpha/beta fold hydrolase [Candidatus Acidoferrales bacterium]|nr:alpha/beta fold hydrolase [Candidatus Acidoferrales bacterium]